MMAANQEPDGFVVHTLRDDEDARVHDWAEEMFLELGYAPAAALELANGHVDWHAIKDLLGHGCPLTLASRLLLPL